MGTSIYLSEEIEKIADSVCFIVDGDDYGKGAIEALEATVLNQSKLIAWLLFTLNQKGIIVQADITGIGERASTELSSCLK